MVCKPKTACDMIYCPLLLLTAVLLIGGLNSCQDLAAFRENANTNDIVGNIKYGVDGRLIGVIKRSEARYEKWLKNSVNPYNEGGELHNDVMHFMLMSKKQKRFRNGSPEFRAYLAEYLHSRFRRQRQGHEKERVIDSLQRCIKEYRDYRVKFKATVAPKDRFVTMIKAAQISPEAASYIYAAFAGVRVYEAGTIPIDSILKGFQMIENDAFRSRTLSKRDKDIVFAQMAICKYSAVFWEDVQTAKKSDKSKNLPKVATDGDGNDDEDDDSGVDPNTAFQMPPVVVVATPPSAPTLPNGTGGGGWSGTFDPYANFNNFPYYQNFVGLMNSPPQSSPQPSGPGIWETIGRDAEGAFGGAALVLDAIGIGMVATQTFASPPAMGAMLGGGAVVGGVLASAGIIPTWP
jgi:hypothetical protein